MPAAFYFTLCFLQNARPALLLCLFIHKMQIFIH